MQSEKVRERTLRAAQELLAEKDVDTITSRDIAQRAGVGLGSINYHFKSRDDLLSQTVLARFRSAAEGYRNAEADAADPKAAQTAQMEERLKAGSAWEDFNLVLCTEAGNYINCRNVNRTLYAISDKYKLPNISIHSLRHTFATRAFEANVNPKVDRRY